MACGGGGDRRALGRCSGAYPVAQTTLDMPRTHLRNGDIPGAQREGVRTHQHTRQTPCTHKPGCGTEQRGGNCTTWGSDTPATRRAAASCSAKPPPLPAWRAPHRLQDRAQCQLARKSSPNAAPPAAFPRKNSPNAPENSVFRPFWACKANFFALAPTIRPSRVNFFVHRTRPLGDVETNDTSAGTDVGQHETAITTARP